MHKFSKTAEIGEGKSHALSLKLALISLFAASALMSMADARETLGLWTFNGESGSYACGNKEEFVFPNRVERSDSLCLKLAWAVLEDRTDGRRFIAFATHLWWKCGLEADAIRELNARHVLCRIDAVRRKWGDLPVVGGGDFNCEKGSLAMNTFAQFGYDDAGEVAPIRSTVPSEHGALVRDAEGRCRGRIGKKGEKDHAMIDHVIVERGRVRALKHDVITDEEAIHISDHSPVVVDFEFVSTPVSAEKQP